MTHECQAPLPSWALLFFIRMITFIFYGCIGLKTNVIQARLYLLLLLLILKELKILLWAPKRICVPMTTVVFPCGTLVKNLPDSVGDARDVGSIPGLGRSPGEGNGYPVQYSCLKNSMDRVAWWATVHGAAKSQTRLSNFTFTFPFHALEKEMATHSSVLAWRIPGTGAPGGLPSMRSHRVGHD